MRRRPTLTRTPTRRPAGRRAFTLIEVLIVVVILGILAGIVVPQFSNAATNARESTLREDLRYLRTQVTAFKYQHRDMFPGYANGDPTATPDPDSFLAQMTTFSDDACGTSAAPTGANRYGPYLAQIPGNPLTGKTGIWVVTGSTMPTPAEDQPYGWIYNATLGKVMANNVGYDTNGQAYASY
ncbi:MAG: hypothetical protein JWO31_3961 [Phycisphaerales bacterium]|nr:hypothetical protein [Phycisphaerales bacterium]